MKIKTSGKRPKQTIIIDDSDYKIVKKHKWWANPQGKVFRVETDLFKEEQKKWGIKRISLARYLLKEKRRNIIVDHINGNPLDNRRQNLRRCTHAENIRNRKINNKNNKSGIRGVNWDKERKKWVAQLMFNRKHIFLGRFTNKEDASKAAIEGREKYYGEFS